MCYGSCLTSIAICSKIGCSETLQCYLYERTDEKQHSKDRNILKLIRLVKQVVTSISAET